MKILTDILIISLFCNGFYLITRDGMLLGFLNYEYRPIESKVLQFLHKPLFGCLPCMASIWGSVGYFALGNSFNLEYPIIIIAVSVTNRIISQIYE